MLSLFAFAKRDKVLQIFRNGEVIQEYNVADIDYIEVNDLIEAPEEINASVGENQITITWSAVDGATYNVYRSPDNVEFTLIASELTQTIYTDSQPLSGSNFYRVKAVVNGVESDYTSAVAATLPSNDLESGVYLGIIGFNQETYYSPITRLNNSTVGNFYNFVNGLTMKNGTLLYSSVDEAINAMQSVLLPADITTAAIVTFTDGLDQGSMMMGAPYATDEEYLEGLNHRLQTETISGVPITAYSIGLRGKDVTDVSMFRSNLAKLSNNPANPGSGENAFEVSNMSEVNEKFKEIADQLSQTSFHQSINVKIPGLSNGTLVRFTFDSASSANKSRVYVEGRFNLKDRSLEDVKYVGLNSTSGSTIKGSQEGIFVSFKFEDVTTADNSEIKAQDTDEWTFISSNSSWQINSEFDKTENTEILTERSSAVIMLVLDCSSSLADDFATAKSNALNFIDVLNAAVDNSPVSGEISASTMDILDKYPNKIILIQVDERVKAEIKKRNIEYFDFAEDEDCNLWIWENTYIENEPTSPGIDGGYDYLSLTVGNQGWSGCGYSTYYNGSGFSEGKDFSMIDNNTRIHFAYRSNSEPAVKSQCVILLDGNVSAGACSAKFSLGEPFNDGGALYPSIAPAPNKNWQVVDISIGELKRVCPSFNLGDLSTFWRGNILSLLSGGTIGANIEIDACFLYNPTSTPLYITGDGDFLNGQWNAETPDQFKVEDGWYVYEVNNLSNFKISKACGDWDIFNGSGLGCRYAEIPDVCVLLESPFDANIYCPWKGNYVIKVSPDFSTIVLSTTTPKPTPWNTRLFLRGDMNSWGSDEAWELENFGNGIFRFICSDEQWIRAGEDFKVADADWDMVNIGIDGDNSIAQIQLGMEQQVKNGYNQTNMYLESDFNGVLWLMLKDAGGDRDVIVLSNDKSFVPSWVYGSGIDYPLSVSDFIKLGAPPKDQGIDNTYVRGYIVGDIPGPTLSAGIEREAPFTVQTNILLADSSSETDISRCITVQLPKGGIRTNLNLVDNPENLRHCVVICGSRETYFNAPGLKAPTSYEWVGEAPTPGSGEVYPDAHIYQGLLESSTSLTGWTVETIEECPELENIFSWKTYDNTYYLHGSSFYPDPYSGSAIVYSDVIDLTDYKDVTVTFEHSAKFQTTLKDLCWFGIREEGATEWTKLTIPTWPEAGAWTWTNSGNIDLSAYNGKKIQLCFWYEGSATLGADTWEIRNVYIDGTKKSID